MKFIFVLLLISLLSINLYSQNGFSIKRKDIVEIQPPHSHKLLSGDLVKAVSEKIKSASLNKLLQAEKINVIVYQRSFPNSSEISEYNSAGLIPMIETWTPPFTNHPFGFFIAQLSPEKINDILSLPFLEKIDFADSQSYPAGNEVTRKTGADILFQNGYKGKGVKVAVLDSGLDTEPLNEDLPSNITKKDYSSYPTLDDDVENRITGHGTHVTGLLIGNGSLSQNNTGNGGGKYSGTAPGADLIFLKIGNDFSGAASTTSIVMAMDAAVNTYNAKIISMSYGNWDTFHDGSSTQDQKVDWCYSNGTAVFLASGNFGNSARHFSGTVSANDSSDFIRVNVSGVTANSTYLNFNLVWFDGYGVRNNLALKYYDSNFNELTNSYSFPTTESIRGTESSISQTLSTLPEGNGTYYLRVVNHSSSVQKFHIYEHYKNGTVTFHNPDPNYTIVSPSTADYAFCVGAYVSRENWTASNSNIYSFNQTLNEVTDFSSRGPRIDGLQKPDIVAPGSALISIRDRDVLTAVNPYWIDNDGTPGGDINYYVMEGTSMSAPVAAGCAALILNVYPNLSIAEMYSAIRNNALKDEFTGSTSGSIYGYGKLNINSAVNDSSLLSSYSVSVNIKLFLEGAYNGNGLSNTLAMNELLPLTQPYNVLPYFYAGEEYVDSIPESTVDWLLCTLISITGADTTSYSKVCLINSDGMVTDIFGNTQLRFYYVNEGNYFIQIKHRTHLKLISSSAIHLTSQGNEIFDFTSTSNNTLNNNALIELSPGIWGSAAGDINADEQVNAHDVNNIWNFYNTSGYHNADLNMDGIVDNADKILAWKNKNKFSGVN
ncbi:MAG: S8 family serine peptidase [Ignavibacteriales bacterium]|nr:MAG: S8 family serine peptidase [Ignavibacteriales bacterium]